jgi:hypothetical protein
MSDELPDRLSRLERQVEALQEELRALRRGREEPLAGPEPPAPVAPPMVPGPPSRSDSVTPPPGPLTAPTRSAARKPARDMESFVGLAVLGRVGIGAVVLAAVYFGQLGWTQLGPVGRVLSVHALGAVLVGAGFALRHRVSQLYVAYLFGGGVALTYVASAFAHFRYDLLGDGLALLALLCSAALGQWLAFVLAVEAVATVSLVLAFAAPFLVGSTATSPTGLFVLALALHTWSAWLERTRGWHAARGVGVLGAVACVLAWYGEHTPIPNWTSILQVEAVVLGVAAPDLIAAARRAVSPAWRDLALAWGLGVAQFAVFLFFGTTSIDTREFGVVAALGMLLGGALLRRRGAGCAAGIARGGSLLLPIAALAFAFQQRRVYALTDDRWFVESGLTAAAVLLAGVRRFTGVGDLGLAFAALLAGLPVTSRWQGFHTTDVWFALLASVPALVLLVTGATGVGPAVGAIAASVVLFLGIWPDGGLSAADGGLASLALVLVAAVGTGAILRSAGTASRIQRAAGAAILCAVAVLWTVAAFTVDAGAADVFDGWPFINWRCAASSSVVAFLWIARARMRGGDGWERVFLAAAALAVVYGTGLAELLDIGSGWVQGLRAISVSLYTLVVAGLLLTAGFLRSVAALRWVGLTGFSFVSIKIVALDLTGAPTPFRILATGVLGLGLLGGAWAYARSQAQIES